ncbi:MAG: RNA polymerase sigma factor [Niabella sp.]
MTCSNSILLAKIKKGDHKVFGKIFEEWHNRVYKYFYKLTHDEYTAKELTQQTFIKFWRYRKSISIHLNIDQQLFQKARLIYINWLRKEATYRKHFSKEEVNDAAQHIEKDTLADLELALRMLPPKRKKVFELKHIHGYSYKEIAEYLNISVKTVDNHLLKATAQLRKSFNSYSAIGIILMTAF